MTPTITRQEEHAINTVLGEIIAAPFPTHDQILAHLTTRLPWIPQHTIRFIAIETVETIYQINTIFALLRMSLHKDICSLAKSQCN